MYCTYIQYSTYCTYSSFLLNEIKCIWMNERRVYTCTLCTVLCGWRLPSIYVGTVLYMLSDTICQRLRQILSVLLCTFPSLYLSFVDCVAAYRGQLDLELTLRDQRMVRDLAHVPRKTKLALRSKHYKNLNKNLPAKTIKNLNLVLRCTVNKKNFCFSTWTHLNLLLGVRILFYYHQEQPDPPLSRPSFAGQNCPQIHIPGKKIEN